MRNLKKEWKLEENVLKIVYFRENVDFRKKPRKFDFDSFKSKILTKMAVLDPKIAKILVDCICEWIEKMNAPISKCRKGLSHFWGFFWGFSDLGQPVIAMTYVRIWVPFLENRLFAKKVWIRRKRCHPKCAWITHVPNSELLSVCSRFSTTFSSSRHWFFFNGKNIFYCVFVWYWNNV